VQQSILSFATVVLALVVLEARYAYPKYLENTVELLVAGSFAADSRRQLR
jgi:hypothetical protein